MRIDGKCGWMKSAAVVILPVSYLLVVSCDDPCSREIIHATTSADDMYTAATLDVGCGATTGYARWILLKERGRNFDFQRDTVAVIDGYNVQINWQGQTLQVHYSGARLVGGEEERNGIKIRYFSED